MTEVVPVHSWTDIVKEVAEGGLLRLAVSKPVQQAIGRLIAGAADVPTAQLESWAQSIRSETAAKKKINAAITNQAVRLASESPDLAQKALDRHTRKLIGRQKSVDAVAIQALRLC